MLIAVFQRKSECYLVVMSSVAMLSVARKRLREDSSSASTGSSSSVGAKKRMVQRKTVEKWNWTKTITLLFG